MENWHTTEMRRVKKLSIESLHFNINDCREAIAANPENPKCGEYMDTIHYCHAELKRRSGWSSMKKWESLKRREK